MLRLDNLLTGQKLYKVSTNTVKSGKIINFFVVTVHQS